MFIIDHIHHLMNESKILIFACNDRMVYTTYPNQPESTQVMLLHKLEFEFSSILLGK